MSKTKSKEHSKSEEKFFLKLFLAKDKVGKDFPLKPGENTIGRAPESNIVIPSSDEFSGISPHHANIIMEDDKIFIQDYSKGGSYLLRKEKKDKGFKKIRKASLEVGDRLKFDVLEAEFYSTTELSEEIPEITTVEIPKEKVKRYVFSKAISEEKVQLFYEEILIGRDRNKCNIIIDEKYNLVSREHAKIIVKDGECQLIDIGSTNGSYIRTNFGDFFKIGVNVHVPLHDNTVIRLGARELKVKGKGRACEIRYIEEYNNN